jgi:uroporphyrinogen-III synthase
MQRNSVLIWTRSQDEGDATSDGLAQRCPFPVIAFPTTQIKKIPLKKTTQSWTDAVVTSPRSVKILVDESLIQGVRHIYCFGTATFEALKKSGFDKATLVDGAKTSEQLAHKLAETLPGNSNVLVVGPKQPAFPIAEFLTQSGRSATHFALYETVPCRTVDPGLARAISGYKSIFAAFASPSAVEGFVTALGPDLSQWKNKITALAIGPTTSRAAASHFPKVLESSTADMTTFENFCIAAVTKGTP